MLSLIILDKVEAAWNSLANLNPLSPLLEFLSSVVKKEQISRCFNNTAMYLA